MSNNDIDDYYVYLFDEEDMSDQMTFNQKKKKNGSMFNRGMTTRVLGFWCFNAGIAFREVLDLKPRSIILTSGTLSPLTSFQAELQIPFEQRIENLHVISNEQVSINVLRKGVKNQPFNFTFKNRDNEEAFIDLGHTVSEICNLTPGGVLIFFPSYRLMEKCHELWSDASILTTMEKIKKVLMEPKDPTRYQATMDAYYKAIFNNNKKN